MGLGEAGALLGLSIADSTSIGTLVIPLWLVMSRGGTRWIVTYLASLGAFYWALGLLLLGSANWVRRTVARVGGSEIWSWSQLTIGAIAFATGVLIDRKRRGGAYPTPKVEKWRSRALRHAGFRGAVVLALLAGALEAASMLPFIAAVGLVASSDLRIPAQGAVLAVYVLVMLIPAFTILALRAVAEERFAAPLSRLERWLSRRSNDLIATLLLIVGGLLGADALIRLDLIP